MQMQMVETKAGHGDLAGAVEDCLHEPLALVQVAVDVLDLDGCIVDQNSDREGHSAERHDIQRVPEGPRAR